MEFWVYENTVHRKARVHRADCSFCGDGHGIHGGGQTLSGKWFGPFPDLERAFSVAENTRQTDIRPCSVCVGAVNRQAVSPAHAVVSRSDQIVEAETWDWDRLEGTATALSFDWVPIGRVTLDSRGKVRLPPTRQSGGLYRFKTRFADGRFACYIGESENLQRRFANYRNPGPTQQTNLRINAWLIELLSSGGEISVAIADKARMTTASGDTEADFSAKSVRRLFEQLAISIQHGSDIETVNR